MQRHAGRVAVTLIAVALAAVVGWQLWVYYMVAPWTRDGRVRADVVGIAPDVSGPVSEVLVRDNQVVRAASCCSDRPRPLRARAAAGRRRGR